MAMADEYKVHMISLNRKGTAAYNVCFGDGGNVQPWHLEVLEKWIAEQRARPDDGSDMV